MQLSIALWFCITLQSDIKLNRPMSSKSPSNWNIWTWSNWKKISSLYYRIFHIGTCDNRYDILVGLNLLTFQSRRRLFDAQFLISVFDNVLNSTSISDTTSLHVPTILIRDFQLLLFAVAQRLVPKPHTFLLQMLSASTLIFLIRSYFFNRHY